MGVFAMCVWFMHTHTYIPVRIYIYPVYIHVYICVSGTVCLYIYM